MKSPYLPTSHPVFKTIKQAYEAQLDTQQNAFFLHENGSKIPLRHKPNLNTHAGMFNLQKQITKARYNHFSNQRRYLFVDVDGVLNNTAALNRGLSFDPVSVMVLEELRSRHHCEIYILSAGWSNRAETPDILQAFGLGACKTIRYKAHHGSKCVSLMDFLNENPSITNFVILEDERSEFFSFKEQLYHIDRNIGLTPRDLPEIHSLFVW